MGKVDTYLPDDLVSADPVCMDKNIPMKDKSSMKYILFANYEKIVEIYNMKTSTG